MKALILLNFKLYEESIAGKALDLAKKIAKAEKNGYEIIVAPSLLMMKEIVDKTKLPVFSQHTDHVELGAHTGRISAQELKRIGARGTILNHSERKVPMKYLTEIVDKCRKAKLKIVICASSLYELKKVLSLEPNYVAYEPKGLIGGDVSVTKANPDLIVEAVEIVKELSPYTKLLVGAGVHTKADVGQALLLGASGVLIGHAVPKSKNPKKFLEGMLL